MSNVSYLKKYTIESFIIIIIIFVSQKFENSKKLNEFFKKHP